MDGMSQQEYVVTFLSIIIGLGLAELLQSLRELIQPQRAVRWHALPLLWVGCTFLAVAQGWWGLYGITAEAVWQNYFAFLVLLITVTSLYLLCSFALPEETSAGEVKLESFYFSAPRRGWFFGSLIVLVVATQGVDWIGDGRVHWSLAEWIRLAFAGLFGGLIATDRKGVHWGATTAALGLLLFFVVRFTLRLGR